MVTQERDGTVEFRFFRPDASHLMLAGDFNGWQPASLPMTRGPDGWWRRQVRLAPGCYQFRYFDGFQWYVDHAAFGVEHGPFGANAVVKVDPPTAGPVEATSSAAVRFPHISESPSPRLG